MSTAPRSRSASRLLYWLPILALFGFWALYETTLTRRFTYDGLCYALDVEFAPPSNLFHPNHLLYSAFSWLLFQGAHLVGYLSRAIFLMQAANALVAAIAVSLLYSTIAPRYGWRRALACAALLGFSNAFWSEAVDSGCYAWAGLATVLLVRLFFWATARRAFTTGLLHGALALVHQMLLLVAPAFLFFFASAKGDKRKAWISMAAYSLGFALAFGLPYVLVASLFHRGSLQAALFWAFGPAGPPPGVKVLSDYWWDTHLGRDLVVGWNSFAESLVAALPVQRWGLATRFVIAAVSIWGAARIGTAYSRWNPSERARLGALLIWVIVLNIFQLFFYIGALRYRILFLAPLLVVLCAAVPPLRSRAAVWVTAVGLAIVGTFNLTFSVGPRHQDDRDYQRTSSVRQLVGPKDFFLFAGRGAASIPNVYMAYFGSSVPARSLWGYIFSRPGADMNPLQALLEGTLAQHGHVYAEKGLLAPASLAAIAEGGPALRPLSEWASHWRESGMRGGSDGYGLVELKKS